MAEIRANCEYKFKEFCISEEIPKSPPIKTKRWTFHDTNPNGRFYNRPDQRKWDEKDNGHVNWPGEINMNQQQGKYFKKPESNLRAEFFNAYKKYYRRVDIKRLEVQSTLNVDAKFKGTDESVEGESSSYKEKECMEINIVMDTEKDDALVSGKVRRSVFSVSPGEELSRGKDRKLIEDGNQLALSDRNVVLGGTTVDDSGYCSSHDVSNRLVTDLPVTSDKKYLKENQPNMTLNVKQGQYSMDRTLVPVSEMSQNCNNVESNSGNHMTQISDKASVFNHERIDADSCSNIVRKTDLLTKDPGSSACFPSTQMAGGNNPTCTGVDERIQNYQNNENAQRVERTFYNSKMKPITKDPGYPPRFRNPDDKSSRSEIVHNKKINYKKSRSSSYIQVPDVARTSVAGEDEIALPMFDNFRPNPSNDCIDAKPYLLTSDTGSTRCFPLAQMIGGNNSTETGFDELIQKDKNNEYVKRVKTTFSNSKMEPNTNELVHPSPFLSRDDKCSRSEIFQNRKKNYKKSMGFSSVNCEGALPSENNLTRFTFENFRPNHSSEILPNAAKSFIVDSNSKNVDQYRGKSDPDEFLTAGEPSRKYFTNRSVSNDYILEEKTNGSIEGQDENPKITVSVFRTESGQELPGAEIIDGTTNLMALKSEDNFSNSNTGIRFRGLCGAPFNVTNKKALKSLVVNVMPSGSIHESNAAKGKSNSFPHEEQNDATKRHEANVDLEASVVYSCPQTPLIENTKPNYCDPVDSSYKKLEVPETFQNITQISENSSDLKNLRSQENSFKFTRREEIEEPFMVWTNKNSTDLTESLKMSKLTISGNHSDVRLDNGNNCNVQSFSGWCNVPEISDNRKDHLKKDFQNSEKRKDKTNFKEARNTSNRNEGKENEKIGTGQFYKRPYSSKTSAHPKYHSHDEYSRNSTNEDQKSKINHERVVSFHGKGSWMNETNGVVRQRHYTEESFDKRGPKQRFRQNFIPNGCLVKESQWTERDNKRTYNKNKAMDESNRIRNGQQVDAGKQILHKQVPNECNVTEQSKINSDEPDGCDKKISKSSNSDILQIGPTYSVHYNPPQKNILRTDQQKNNYDDALEREEIGDRFHLGSANTFHHNHENATGFICRNRNETLHRNVCNHSSPVYCDNYLNTCPEIICSDYCQANIFCGYRHDGSRYCYDCESLNRRPSHVMLKNNHVFQRHVRDTNLHCHNQNNYICPVSFKHRRHTGCPCQEGIGNYYQEYCDGQMRFLCKECSPNNMLCSCLRCSTEMRINAPCARKGKCCYSCPGNEQMNCSPQVFDRERQWTATGHQPARSVNKCPVDANIQRPAELSAPHDDDAKESFISDFGDHCPENLSLSGERYYPDKFESPDNRIRNNSESYDKEVENECKFDFTKNGTDRNHPLRDIKTERKYHQNAVDCGDVNFSYVGMVDNADIKESKASCAKLVQEELVGVERKQFASEDKTFCMADASNSHDGKSEDTEVTLKGSDRSIDEPLFLCEEQWDSEDELSMRRVIRNAEETNEEKGGSSDSVNEPIYLREEHWESDDEDVEVNEVFHRGFRPPYFRHPNDFRKGQRSADKQSAGRNGYFSEGEESRKCSSVHAVSDPSFHCEQQWASDEEKCEDHKFQSTLPKNRTRKKKGSGKSSFNPRRWDMVTDLPKNEYMAQQNGNCNRRNNYEGSDYSYSRVFQNRKYHSNNEQ